METHVVRREGVMEKLRGAMSLFTPALLVFMAGMILANIAGAMNGSLMPLYVQSLGADTKQIVASGRRVAASIQSQSAAGASVGK